MKQEETIRNSLREMEERHRKEMDALHEKYGKDLENIRIEIENKFKEMFQMVDVKKLS